MRNNCAFFPLSYDGNRLTGVSEAAADYDVAGSFEYKKAKGSEYIYNSNGSLVADKSRGIAYITYDVNNNPQNIYFTNGNETRYMYSASGEKLRVTHYVAMPNITRTFGVKPEGATQNQIMFAGQKDYLLGGSLVMQEEKIDKVLFDGGYLAAERLNTTTYGFTPYYYNQDHLGNNREVVNGSGTVQQVTRSTSSRLLPKGRKNYYPSGAPYADPAAVVNASFQPYKYNGKELDLMHGLDTYDYGARQYDPVLARWDRMDPLCEKYYSVSPYAYCGNNPVRFIDPNGMKYDLSNLTESQLKQYNNEIDMLRKDCLSFSQLYEELEKSENIFTISLGNPTSVGNGEKIDGHFIANDAGGGEIVFSKTKFTNGIIPPTAFVEEFFHAYQHENANLYNGLFNYEFEAKVFATVVGKESGLGCGSFDGMIDYQARINTNKYGNSSQPISPKVIKTIQFQQEYIKSANSYAKYNREHKVGDPHYRCTTKGLPYSLMKIINSAYSK